MYLNQFLARAIMLVKFNLIKCKIHPTILKTKLKRFRLFYNYAFI